MEGGSTALSARCEDEILALHRFFTDWLTGRVEPDEEIFTRLSEVLAAGFHRIAPDGTLSSRSELLASLRLAHGSKPKGFAIRIRNFAFRAGRSGGLGLVNYEEWQDEGGTSRGRIATALLRSRQETPHGVEWLHVHETWLPEGADPGA